MGLLTLVLGSFSILDEPSEGSQSSPWAYHDHWADGTVGQPEARVSDKDGQVDNWATYRRSAVMMVMQVLVMMVVTYNSFLNM